MGRLDGKVALVTGAGRGIGRSIAKRFAAEGASIGVLSLTPGNVDAVVKEITDAGHVATGIVCDVGDGATIEAAVQRLAEAYGTIDILVNNANDPNSVLSSVLDLDEEMLFRQIRTGPLACLRFMQACYPYLEKRGGRVINLASTVGVAGSAQFTPYAMAKEATRALTRVAAREWGGKGITVNALIPVADTDLFSATNERLGIPPEFVATIPIPRVGSPDADIAPIALFLASEDAQYMTGYSFMGDGGQMIDAGR